MINMKRTLLLSTLALIGTASSNGLYEFFRNKTSGALAQNPLSLQVVSDKTPTSSNCSTEQIDQLSKLYQPGEEFMFKVDKQ